MVNKKLVMCLFLIMCQQKISYELSYIILTVKSKIIVNFGWIVYTISIVRRLQNHLYIGKSFLVSLPKE